MAYSQGYSPHPILSFAAPLGVGLTSEAEYLDLELVEAVEKEAILLRLNEQMADGMQITGWHVLKENAKNAMSIVAAADYEIVCETAWEQAWHDFVAQPEIIICKQTKTKQVQIDLAPLIDSATISEHALQLQLPTGSVCNIKPELILQSFFDFMQQPFSKAMTPIHRKQLYACKTEQEEYIPLEFFETVETMG